jgi:HK97 family phage major capsid protein
MQRLGELTAEILGTKKDTPFLAFAAHMLKHGGDFGLMERESNRLLAPLPTIIKAAVAAGNPTVSGWASEIAAFAQISQDFITENTRTSVLGALDYVPAPFMTALGVETTAPVAAWVGPGGMIPMKKPVLADIDPLQRTKLAFMIALTEELFQTTGVPLLNYLRDTVSRVINYGSDRALIDPFLGGTADNPASLLYGQAPTQSTGSAFAQIEADLAVLFAAIGTNLFRTLGVVAPSTALFLAKLKNTAGAAVFPDMGAVGGAIWGVKFVVSDAAVLTGSPGGNVIAMLDGSKIIVADEGLLTLDVGRVTSAQFTDSPVAGAANQTSAFQTNARILRAMRYLNWSKARSDATAWTTVNY